VLGVFGGWGAEVMPLASLVFSLGRTLVAATSLGPAALFTVGEL